jgi:hypothetical protein
MPRRHEREILSEQHRVDGLIAKTLAVPELVVVAFWFVPFAVLTNWDVVVPALLQATSVAVVVQTNCAEAGERARSANAANAIADSVAA